VTVAALAHYSLRWIRSLGSAKALAALLSSFGTLWLAVEIATFFLDGTDWPTRIRSAWPWFGGAGLVAAAILCKPARIVSQKLNGRDILISITVGDMFSMPGALIIGSNTTFDTKISNQLIAATSIQGIFTTRYYAGEGQLDLALNAALTGNTATKLPGKRLGKNQRYPFGTCARVHPKDRTAYFVAIADINEHGVASSQLEDLKNALSKLWVFIGTRGTKESLVMPVLGTGFSRLSQPREEIVREIIRSFIAACSERTFADSLTIAIAPQDVMKHSISLDSLGAFLAHECRYASFANNGQPAVGTAL
jgi:hypothetical protein